MEYTEMVETLKEHEDNLPEGITLEAVKQARETMSDLYEACKGFFDAWDGGLQLAIPLKQMRKALAKAES